MRRERARRLAGGVGVVLGMLVLGCDSSPPGPPVVSERDEASPSGPRVIALIEPARRSAQVGLWEQMAMMVAGDEKALMQVHRPESYAPLGRQAELVREAVDNGADALIVIPGEESQNLAEALENVRDQGVSIVLLNREVEVRGEPLPLVTFTASSEAARNLVEVMLQAARKADFPAEGPALILRRTNPDADRSERNEALRAALTEAGVTVLPDRTYSGDWESAIEALKAAYRDEPKPVMVFTEEDDGLLAASSLREDLTSEGNVPFILGGFAAQRRSFDQVDYGEAAGLVDLNLGEAARRAVTSVLALAQGKEIPARVEIPRTVRVLTGTRARSRHPPPMWPAEEPWPVRSTWTRGPPRPRRLRRRGSLKRRGKSNRVSGRPPGPRRMGTAHPSKTRTVIESAASVADVGPGGAAGPGRSRGTALSWSSVPSAENGIGRKSVSRVRCGMDADLVLQRGARPTACSAPACWG